MGIHTSSGTTRTSGKQANDETRGETPSADEEDTATTSRACRDVKAQLRQLAIGDIADLHGDDGAFRLQWQDLTGCGAVYKDDSESRRRRSQQLPHGQPLCDDNCGGRGQGRKLFGGPRGNQNLRLGERTTTSRSRRTPTFFEGKQMSHLPAFQRSVKSVQQ